MNYEKLYSKIITRAATLFLDRKQEKGIGKYYELHHILPKCLGGSNKQNNLVYLTAREHFICHRILTRMHPNHFGILNAYLRMCSGTQSKFKYNPSSRAFQEAKELFAKKISSIHKGRKRLPETIKRLSQAKQGEKNPMFGKCGINSPRFGKPVSEENKQKYRNLYKGVKREFKTIQCPYCQLQGKENVMYRWHFKNCKKKKEND